LKGSISNSPFVSPHSPERVIAPLLRARGLTLATAESCTGGLIGHLITNVPGSSDYYLGGVVSYANQAKIGLLGVRPETIERYGAVSEQTACEMAQGVRGLLGADLGLSVTGIAGPGGGTPEKPVGLTWIGISTPAGVRAQRFVWQRDRVGNKEESARAALLILLAYLEEKER